jgi:ribosome assembly protein YihI (activator of Der GTPase)
MQREVTCNYLIKMIELKTLEFKLINPNITVKNVTDYLLDVLKSRKITDVSDGAYIFNLKVNRIIEFMNNQGITDNNLSLDNFKDMFTTKKIKNKFILVLLG